MKYGRGGHLPTHYCFLYQGFLLRSLSFITFHIYALESLFCVEFSLRNWTIFGTLWSVTAVYALTRALTYKKNNGVVKYINLKLLTATDGHSTLRKCIPEDTSNTFRFLLADCIRVYRRLTSTKLHHNHGKKWL
jgi:hypothetical protein